MIAYADCFAGISGDMALGALLDAGGERAVLDATVEALGLGNEVRVETRREQRGHLGGTRVLLHTRQISRREVPQLQRMVSNASLPETVRSRTLQAIDKLADAESRVHGVSRDELHLHELGGADTVVDLAGAFWLLESMEIGALYASPLPTPRGWLGDMPLPAPAALQVLTGTGAVLQPVDSSEELVTPTGAAILAVAGRFERPALQLERIGYGIGGREHTGNALGLWVGHPAPALGDVSVLETNLDDMPPNLIAALTEDVMAAGALDVTVTPVLMKKGRPGHVLTVLAEPSRAGETAAFLLRHSSTLGVRMTQAARVVAKREVVEITSPFGPARVKVKELDGRIVDMAPEYEDVRRLAHEAGQPLQEVMRTIAESARDELAAR